MVQFTISSVKDFIHSLLKTELFDSFYLSEAQITTYNSYHIDGHLQKAFFQDLAETEPVPDRPYSFWKENKLFCFHLIRGRRVPLQMKFVLLLSDTQLRQLISDSGLSLHPEDIAGCFLNITYADGTLTCTSGTSLKQVSLDKSLEKAWDQALERFLNLHNFL